MNEFLDYIAHHFENCVWLAVMIMAMIPTIESKIAIPFGMNTEIWGSNALNSFESFFYSFLGSIIPCILIVLIVRKLKSRTTGFLTNKFLQKYNKKSQSVSMKTNNFTKYFMLTAFVAIPLPLTGVWSGSLILGLSNLDIKMGIISIIIGAIISAGMISLICNIFSNSISYILIISFIIILVFLFVDLFISLLREHIKNKKVKNDK